MPSCSRAVAGLAAALWLCASGALAAQRCAEPERAALDPWLGDWVVSTTSGREVARTVLRRVLDGCAVEQDWEAGDGMRARALYAWQARTGTWHLSWVETRGPLMLLEGGLEDGRLILEGDVPTREGGVTRRRVSFAPIAGDTWRQTWAESLDRGATWEDSFSLVLERSPSAGTPD